jgi:hypothetical protein
MKGVNTMKGVLFGAYHSYKDLHLILSEKEIGAPEVKTHTLDIPGGDGVIDYTDFFGEPKYSNVQHRFTFTTIQPRTEFLLQYSTVKNALHGKKVRIILDDDPTFFYIGRCEVSSFKNEKGIGTITITCDCEPYKYNLEKTVVYQAVDGVADVLLLNGRKRAVPEVRIESAAGLNIVYGGSNVWDLGSGTYTLPELELVEGENVVTVTGVGTIVFTWQEGDL